MASVEAVHALLAASEVFVGWFVWLCWKQLRGTAYRRYAIITGCFFKLHLGTFYHFLPARDEPQQLIVIYWSPWWSNEEEEASGGVQQVGVTDTLQSAFSFSPGILQGPVESPSLLPTQASQVKNKVLKSTHGVKTNL